MRAVVVLMSMLALPMAARAVPATQGYGVSPAKFRAGATVTLTVPTPHPKGLAVKTPHGILVYVVDAGTSAAFLQGFADKDHFTFKTGDLKGVTNKDGKRHQRKVFVEAGTYEFYLADDLSAQAGANALSYEVSYKP